MSALDCLLKRIEKGFAHGSLGEVAGAVVGAILWLSVNEVFFGGDDVVCVGGRGGTLQSCDRSNTHCCHEVGIFGVHLLVATVNAGPC